MRHGRGLACPGTVTLAGLAILATACHLGLAPRLAAALVADADRIRAGELWRLATGPLVHATWGHLLRDLAVLAVVGVPCEAPLGRAWWPLCAVTLLAPPLAVVAAGWHCYLGLSGLGHGLIAAVLAHELLRGRRPPWLVAAALGLLAKLMIEGATGAALFPMDLGPGVVQVPLAHSAGVLAGVAVAWIEAPRAARACGLRVT